MQVVTDSSMVIAMGEWTPSEKQSLPVLHERFVNGLGAAVITDLKSIPATVKPLDLRCRPPLPPNLRVYVFNCTDHPSERRPGDYRIQLRLAGQRRGQRATLALDPAVLVLLAGYIAEFDVFVLWDANAHSEFPYSKGVQVGAPAVHYAAVHGVGSQRRDVHGNGSRYVEHVVTVRSDRLPEGVLSREKLTLRSLLGQADSATSADAK